MAIAQTLHSSISAGLLAFTKLWHTNEVQVPGSDLAFGRWPRAAGHEWPLLEGYRHMLAGNRDVAIARLREAVVQQSGGYQLFHAEAASWLAVCLAEDGRPHDAQLATHEPDGVALIPGQHLRAKAAIAVARNDLSTALTTMDAAVDAAHAAGCWSIELEYLTYTHWLAVESTPDRICDRIAVALRHVDAPRLVAAGEAALAVRRRDGAEILDHAIRLDAIGMSRPAHRLAEMAACLLTKQSGTRGAEATLVAGRLRQSLGVPTTSGQASPLTARELEISALAASGLSDRDIIYTGGWSVPVQLVRDLAEVVHKVTVSVDGATAEVHDRVRGRAGSFDHAMTTLGRFDDEAARRAEAGLEPLRFGIDYVVTRTNFDQVEQVCSQVAPRFPYLDSLAFGAVMPIGLASRPSYVEHELITDEQTEKLVSPAMLQRLRLATPESVTVETFDNNNAIMHPDYIAAHPDLRPLEVEPDGEVRAMAIYEGTIGSLLDEDPFVLWRRARARWDDPFVVDILKDVRTRAEWAEAVRRIDYRYGTDDDRARFDKRPVFVP